MSSIESHLDQQDVVSLTPVTNSTGFYRYRRVQKTEISAPTFDTAAGHGTRLRADEVILQNQASLKSTGLLTDHLLLLIRIS
jgi:hypothetical protein